MRTFTKTATIGMAIMIMGTTGALAGKSTTPNPIAPPTVVAVDLGALNALLSEGGSTLQFASVTFDGTSYTITTTDGQVVVVSSAFMANILAGYL
jgi:hypothetical protein